MRCTSPRTVGFKSDGKTLCWSPKYYSKEFPTFQLPCGKCISCRLEYARQWAVRCVHEAQMHQENAFITLTYDDEHLESEKLIYKHFQDFMKRLREKFPLHQIGVFVTGEYGDQKKRPHWHACIFGWLPPDAIHKYTNDRGDHVYSSKELTRLWGKGIAEFGSITLQSAGYCARYSAKKLIHGPDQEHEYHPISKKSSKHAIGKRWIEKYWKDVFNHGHIVLADGTKCAIPRYYEKWLQKNLPQVWAGYVTGLKAERIKLIEEKEKQEKEKDFKQNLDRLDKGKSLVISKDKARKIILEQKFKQLQSKLKL